MHQQNLTRWRLCLLLTVAVLSLPQPAEARRRARKPRRAGERVLGHVVQVTARFVYINIGSRQGLRPGDAVRLSVPGRKRVTAEVVDVWARGARVAPQPGSRKPKVGARVVSRWRGPEKPPKARPVRQLPLPDIAETMSARWEGIARPPPLPPAKRHQPTVRGVAVPRRFRGLLRFEYMGLYDLDAAPQSNYHRMALWSELDVPRLFASWLSYSHRIRLRHDIAADLDQRPFEDSRPLPLVYRLRFGLRGGPVRAAIGRTAAAPLGPAPLVDGAAGRVRIGPLYVGVFGGLQPRIQDLAPTTDATLFGGHVSLRLAGERLGLRDAYLSADLGFVGSTWRGDLDRSALSGQLRFDLQRRLSLLAEATLDLYGVDHPSQLDSAELTTLVAQVDGTPWRWLRIGARFDRYRFVPTRESLEAFPRDFVLQAPVNALRGYADVSWSGGRWVVGGTGGWERQGPESWVGWGELDLRRRSLVRDGDFLRLAGQAYRGNFLRSVGGRVTYEFPLAEWLTGLGGYGLWRDALVRFDDRSWRHSAWVGLDASVGKHWLVGVQGEALLAEQERVMQLFGSCAYRFWI